jgi:hypothetical protein
MIDYHTPQRKAWLSTLQPKPILSDALTLALCAIAFLLALFL